MNVTVADAIGDSKRQFTNCYPSPTMPVMTNPSTSIAILRRLVLEAGGPAEFSRAYSRDDADKPIDPTYVSAVFFRPNKIALAIANSICYRSLPDHKTEPIMASQTQHPILIESRRIARLGGCMVCEKNGEFRVYRKTPDRPVYLGSRTSPETLRRFVQRLTTVA